MAGSRGFLSSLDNVSVDRLRISDTCSGDELIGYSWYRPSERLEVRRRITEERRCQLLEIIYHEELNTEQAEGLVKEWVVLVTERDRLLRELLEMDIDPSKSSYFRDLRRVLRTHPPLADTSEELRMRETLLTLEQQVNDYCTRRDLTSPPGKPTSSQDVKATSDAGVDAVALDHQTGQPRRSLTDETDHPTKATPTRPNPPLPAKPADLIEKLKASPQRSPVKRPGKAGINKLPQSQRPGVDDCLEADKENTSPLRSADNAKVSVATSAPRPPPLSSLAVGEGEPLLNDTLNEASDPSLELPSSESRSSLMSEISSVGQTILRRTNRDRSPGGTPLRQNKNRLTLTGNTDVLQRALISKFRSFHSTPIKQTRGTRDSMEVSNAWSDVNGSLVYEDPDITTTPSSLKGISNMSAVLVTDPNLSSAV